MLKYSGVVLLSRRSVPSPYTNPLYISWAYGLVVRHVIRIDETGVRFSLGPLLR